MFQFCNHQQFLDAGGKYAVKISSKWVLVEENHAQQSKDSDLFFLNQQTIFLGSGPCS